ncbi:dermonecrotic toxin domain-containing protein [Pseudomonas sp. B21-035]|uniref:dermonecrotic toxin domain-containing protein n=1 Tax=Pseudomonas sp. B21-035 TaxID=2895484 RepID=UPI00215E4717|nr:DUF6543 domain-containing protein [Pseudomonas sp. B21-035]UVL58592.1 hypothetical protein LOY22_11705 [Pseudomonas sp. B21-035]
MTTDTLTPFKSHERYFNQQIPTWLSHASTHAIKELHQRQLPPAQSAADTDAQLRQALSDSLRRTQASSAAAARVLRQIKGISEFAEPLLRAEINKRFALDISVTANELVHMRDDASLREDRLASVLISRQPLLQAALQNFTASDAEIFRTDTYSAVTAVGALQPFPSTVDPERRAHQSIRYASKLPISPQQFAKLCRELDIGQQYQDHLKSILDAAHSRDAVRRTLVAAARDRCESNVHAARIAGHISEPAYHMLKQMLRQSASAPATQTLRVDKVYESGSSAFDGSRCYLLNLFGSTLGGGFLLLGPDPAGQALPVPVVVIMPGDAKPVQEYDSYADFYRSLKARLQDPQFQGFFSRFVGRRGQSTVFAQLKQSDNWHAHPPRLQEIRGECFDYLHSAMLARAWDDARTLAVPTADVDRDAWLQELNHYLGLGFSMLNVAAFFVPGLGEVMMVALGAQLLGDLFNGLQAWEANDQQQAISYLQSFGINLAITAGLGVAAGAAGAALSQPLAIDALEVVELPGGEVRLWRPDLAPYQQSTALLEGHFADAQGIYRVAGKRYIRIEGKPLEITQDSHLGKWRVEHPDDPQAYRPVLEHNGEGAWHHALERVDSWPRPTLVRRLGHAFEGWADAALERMADISGVSDAELRAVYSDDQPAPAALLDVRRRFEIDRLIAAQIDNVRTGQGLQSGFNYPVSLLPELPRWPQGKAVELYDSAELWGQPMVYGRAQPEVAAIKLSRSDLAAGRLIRRVVEGLSVAERSRWFGNDHLARDLEAEIGQQLAEQMQASRSRIFDSLYLNVSEPLDPLQTALQRDFQGLSRPLAEALVKAASEVERSRWQASGRVPLTLAKRAREASRQVRLSRACEGLEISYLANDDNYRLALHLLPELSGWSDSVHLSVRRDSVSGTELDSIGSAGATSRKTLVKSAQGWRAFDENDAELSGLETADHGFFTSLLQALPDSERVALGLNIGDSTALRRALLVQAARQPAKARLALGMAVEQGRFRPPLPVGAGRRGYPLGGTIGRLLPRTYEQRLRSLFPDKTDEQLRDIVRNAVLQGENLENLVGDLEQELEAERQGLSSWVEQGATNTARERRRQLAMQLLDVWQLRSRAPLEVSEYQVDGAPGYVLTLNSPRVDALPPLTSAVGQILELELSSMTAISELPAEFLSAYPNLRRLSVRHTPITQIPQNIGQLSELRVLDLTYSRTGLAHLARLGGLRRLWSLDLRGVSPSPVTVTAEQLAPLRQLSGLRFLSLMENEASFGPGAFAELAGMPNLRRLYLTRNNITLSEADVSELAGITNLRELSMGHNPLVLTPDIRQMPRLRLLALPDAHITGWPLGLETTANFDVRLEGNAIIEVPAGAGRMPRLLFGYEGMSEALTTRLIRERMAVQAEPGADVRIEEVLDDGGDTDLSAYQQLTQEQEHTALELFRLPESRSFRRLLARLLTNGQVTEPQAVQLIEAAAADPEQLGRQLFAQAVDADTCEDRDIVVFSDLQGLREADQALGQGGQASRQLLALGISRWRLQRLRTYVAEQIRGWQADPQFVHFIDAIEVELYYRIHLAERLGLRHQPTEMIHGHTVFWVTSDMLAEAARIIRQDQAALLPEWMTQEIYWQDYLKRRYRARYEALQAQLAGIFDPATGFMEDLQRLRGTQADLTTPLPVVAGETAEQLASAFALAPSELAQLAYDEATWIQAYRKLQDAREVRENELPGVLTKEEIGRDAG